MKLYIFSKNIFIHYKKNIIFSFVSAIGLWCLCYFANNSSLFTGEDVVQYYYMQKICSKFGIHRNVDYGEALYFNIAYDKILLPRYQNDSKDHIIGNTIITDRQKLIEMLTLLHSTNTYKYIIIDLRFEPKDITEIDDSLFSLIDQMRNIVFVDDGSIIQSSLYHKNKVAQAYYFKTPLSTNFSRYQYIIDGKRSLPLHIYEDLHPEKKFSSFGFGPISLYFSGSKLCQNSNFLIFDSSTLKDSQGSEFINASYFDLLNCENLGEYLTLLKTEYDNKTAHSLIANRCQNKYVVFGNTIDDIHDTYVGEKSGIQIIMRALQTLEEGNHKVSGIQTFIWILIFFIITMAIISDKSISNIVPVLKKIPYKFIHYLLSILSYSIFLFIISILDYIIFERVYSLTLPIIYFSTLKMIVQYRKFDKV